MSNPRRQPDRLQPTGAGSRRGGGADILGWDIGGVNIKAARVTCGRPTVAHSARFIVRDAPDQLVPVLRSVARRLGARRGTSHAVTMTAELSRIFRTKREGVAFVIHAMAGAFPDALIAVYGVGGLFFTPVDAIASPRLIAAANWSATAQALARPYPHALLIDTGTTTTDIIPIVNGRVVALGRTDPERLISRELVYTGAVRTPTEALASVVPVSGVMSGTSAEGFALAGDVHVWRGELASKDYSGFTPDGRPATRRQAGVRLARVVCADREMLSDREISRLARALNDAQVARIAEAAAVVRRRHPSIRLAVVAGLGAFLGRAAARQSGLRVMPLSRLFGEAGSRAAAAVGVGLLWEAKRRTTR
jgi:probable H4MPT-linked C1 transfer pathway protein